MFVQDFPRIDTTNDLPTIATTTSGRSSSTEFETDLYKFILKLGVPKNVLDTYLSNDIDYSNAKVHLITSTPGFHRGNNAMRQVGHVKLRNLVHKYQKEMAPPDASTSTTGSSDDAKVMLPPEIDSFVYQSSSMQSKRMQEAFYIQMNKSCMGLVDDSMNESKKAPLIPPLKIVFSTVGNVKNSFEVCIKSFTVLFLLF